MNADVMILSSIFRSGPIKILFVKISERCKPQIVQENNLSEMQGSCTKLSLWTNFILLRICPK